MNGECGLCEHRPDMKYNHNTHTWECPHLPESSHILSPIKPCWKGKVIDSLGGDGLAMLLNVLSIFEDNPNIQIERKELHFGTTDMTMVLEMESGRRK